MSNYIDMSDYNDVPDYRAYCPDCPKCGTTMGYSYYQSEFKCPTCGHVMDEYDLEFDEEDLDTSNRIPWCCRACGGPWPDCKVACNIYDD